MAIVAYSRYAFWHSLEYSVWLGSIPKSFSSRLSAPHAARSRSVSASVYSRAKSYPQPRDSPLFSNDTIRASHRVSHALFSASTILAISFFFMFLFSLSYFSVVKRLFSLPHARTITQVYLNVNPF